MQCDPDIIAEKILAGDLGQQARMEEITRAHSSSFAKAVYASFREFHEAVNEAIFNKSYPKESTATGRGEPVFESRPDVVLHPNGDHDLVELMHETVLSARQILNEPNLEFKGSVRWTERSLKGWFGKAFWDSTPPEIRINCLLNSRDFSAASLRFLLWHELLHVYLRQGHTTVFRQLEHKWPGWRDADREMDTLNERFSIFYGIRAFQY